MRQGFAWDKALLYGILDAGYLEPRQFAGIAAQLVAGGVDLLQIRAKGNTPEQIALLARDVLPVCREAGVPLLINDHPRVAAACGADGVHVGQDDCAVAEARKILGPGGIVGKSTHSLAQALAAQDEGPDYIGFGPLFATPTKPEYVPVGLHAIGEVVRRVALPVFCIGGISPANLAAVIAAGARRAVLVSALLKAPDVAACASACRALLGGVRR